MIEEMHLVLWKVICFEEVDIGFEEVHLVFAEDNVIKEVIFL